MGPSPTDPTPRGPAEPRPSRAARVTVPLALLAAAAAAALGVTALVRSGLDPAVAPPPPLADAEAARRCVALVAGLPDTLSGQERRGTRPASDLTTAYGTPAVTVRCGVQEPGATADFTCLPSGGADWLAVPREGETLFLSYGTTPAVEVRVPDDYTVPPLEGIGPSVARLPRNGRQCS